MIVMGFSKATDYLGYLRSKTGLRIDFNYFFFFCFLEQLLVRLNILMAVMKTSNFLIWPRE